MVEKALQWAKKTNNHRVSKIHGEEEMFIVLAETFNSTEKDEEQVDREGTMTVEACHDCISYLIHTLS